MVQGLLRDRAGSFKYLSGVTITVSRLQRFFFFLGGGEGGCTITHRNSRNTYYQGLVCRASGLGLRVVGISV